MNEVNETTWLNINLIDLPTDARTHSPEKLESLAEDLKINGQLQEIIVAPASQSSGAATRYELIAGVGRFLSAQKLGWDKIRCLIKEGLSEFEKARITYSENEEREDVDPFYQASQLQKMMLAKDLTQEQLADSLGKGLSNVKNYLSLLKLSTSVQEIARRLAISISALIEITKLPEEAHQISLIQEFHDKDLSIRRLKAFIDKQLAGNTDSGAASPKKLQTDHEFKLQGSKVLIKPLPYELGVDPEGFIAGLQVAFLAYLAQVPEREAASVA